MDWFLKNYEQDVAVEVKIVGEKVLAHQLSALLKVFKGIFCIKLPDVGIRNPFDFIVLKNADALIAWYDPKTKKCSIHNHNNLWLFDIVIHK